METWSFKSTLRVEHKPHLLLWAETAQSREETWPTSFGKHGGDIMVPERGEAKIVLGVSLGADPWMDRSMENEIVSSSLTSVADHNQQKPHLEHPSFSCCICHPSHLEEYSSLASSLGWARLYGWCCFLPLRCSSKAAVVHPKQQTGTPKGIPAFLVLPAGLGTQSGIEPRKWLV